MSTSRENMHRMQTRKPMNKCRVIGHKGARPVPGRSAGARPVPGRSAWHTVGAVEEFRYSKLQCATPGRVAADGDRPRSGARPVPGRSAWHTVGAVEEFRYSKLQCATPGWAAADGDRPRSGARPVPARSAWHTVGALEEFRYSKLQCATPGWAAADGDRPRSGTAPATGDRPRPGALATLLRSAVGTFMLSASCLFAGQQISAAAPSPTPAAATVLKQDTIPSAQPNATSIVHDSTTETNGSVTLKMDALDEKHKLAIGDRLSFRIEEDQEDPKPLTV